MITRAAASSPTRRQLRAGTAALVLLLGGTLSACGGDDPDTSSGSGDPEAAADGAPAEEASLTHEEYIDEVEGLCADVGKEIEELELEGSEPTDPAGIADAFEAFGETFGDLADRFEAIEPPAEDAAAAADVPGPLREVSAAMTDVADKARGAADMEEVEKLDGELDDTLFEKADEAWANLGFPEGMEDCVAAGSADDAPADDPAAGETP
jgi:hypothetical protein